MLRWLKHFFASPPMPVAATPPAKEPDLDPVAMKAALETKFGHLARPAIHLSTGGNHGFSRLGGLPLLPPSLDWPELEGKPLAFLAQIDLAEIHTALPSFLPQTGFLYFFYDQDQSAWGFDPKDAPAWRVLHFEGDADECAPRSAPEGVDPSCIYQEKLIVPRGIDLLPDHESLGERLEPEPLWETYQELRRAPFKNQTRHQMLGYPSPVQNPDMELECQLASNGLYCGDETGYKDPRVAGLKAGAADWKLLLQLDSDDEIGWMWGDVGTLYFWVREQDARCGDFGKVWMIFQCC